MVAREFEGLLNAHAYLRVERPPVLWTPEADVEPFVRLLGWSPETSWRPDAEPTQPLVTADLRRAAAAAGVAYGYTRAPGGEQGSVTVFFRRGAAG